MQDRRNNAQRGPAGDETAQMHFSQTQVSLCSDESSEMVADKSSRAEHSMITENTTSLVYV